MKHILLLRASSDVCQVEVDQIQTIAKMHGMEPVLHMRIPGAVGH
jgi:hypothetical protein